MPEIRSRANQPTGLKEWIRRLLHSRRMPVWLVVLSFFENTILLLPIEPLLIPVMAMRRGFAFVYAGLLTLGCVLGAVATYWAAAAAFEPLVEPAMRAGGILGDFESVRGDIQDRGFWALFVIGVTPVPFQLGTVASGVIGLSLADFIAAVTLSRAVRYFALAGLVYAIGWRAEDLIERYESEIAIGAVVLFALILVGGWLAARLF